MYTPDMLILELKPNYFRRSFWAYNPWKYYEFLISKALQYIILTSISSSIIEHQLVTF